MSILGKIYIVVTAALVLLSVYVMFFRDNNKRIDTPKTTVEKPVAKSSVKSAPSNPDPTPRKVDSAPATPEDLTIEPTENKGALLQWYSPDNDVDEFVILSTNTNHDELTEYARVPGYRYFFEVEPVDLYDTRYFSVYAINKYGASRESELVKHDGYYEKNRRRGKWDYTTLRITRLVLGLFIWGLFGFPALRYNRRGFGYW